MHPKRIMVIGQNGQLAKAFGEVLNESSFDYRMFPKERVNILNNKEVEQAFEQFQPDICINCAAYTNVDKAEEEVELAFDLNSNAVYELGEICKSHDCLLIHFSTDYVYDNGQDHPLKEDDITKPSSVYGRSKREGEKALATINYPSLIFRVSWLYAPWGHNFINTMLRLAKSNQEIKVVFDQIGCPTYAPQLAKDVLNVVDQLNTREDWGHSQGLYNYTHSGIASWYDIAYKLFRISGIDQRVIPVTSDQFKRPAERPNYSVLNIQKVKDEFGIQTIHWEECLLQCIKRLDLAKNIG